MCIYIYICFIYVHVCVYIYIYIYARIYIYIYMYSIMSCHIISHHITTKYTICYASRRRRRGRGGGARPGLSPGDSIDYNMMLYNMIY